MAMQAAALREMESTQQLWARGHEEELREHLRLVEQQAEAFRLEAERARRQMEREVWTRLAPPAPSGRAPAPVAPRVPPAAPARAACRRAPSRGSPEPPDAAAPAVAILVRRGGRARDHGDGSRRLRGRRPRGGGRGPRVLSPPARRRCGPKTCVTVAVDFVPDRLFRKPPTRTLLVRVRARDLQERQAGRLTAAELRQRLEFEED